MKLSYSRYEEIKKVITNLYVDYNLDNLPIDVFALAKKMGICIKKYSDFSFDEEIKLLKCSSDGMNFYNEKEKRYVIIYNDRSISDRIRFTIAHEIGHIILGHKESSEVTESEADFFARNLLVPICVLYSKEITGYKEIAELFKVSYTVASIAINNLEKRNQYGYMKLEDYEIELLKQLKMIK